MAADRDTEPMTDGRRPACVTMTGVTSGSLAEQLAAATRRLALTPRGPAVVLTRLSPPTPASAVVVEAVVDLLHDAGCAPVSVAGRVTAPDRDRGHRTVAALAEGAGLHGRTPRGRSYSIVDLGDELEPAPVPEASVLSGRPIAKGWAGATTRVVIARAVTDLMDGYAGSLATLLAAAPEVAEAEDADVGTDLAAYLPVDLVVVDALAAAVGADGGRRPRLLDSRTLVVATDPVLADTATAALLGQDRSSSRVVQRAIARRGSPTGAIEGSLAPLPGVSGPPPRLREAARALATEPRLGRVLAAAVGGPDVGAEPDDAVLGALWSFLTPLIDAAGQADQALALEAVLTAAHLLAHGRVAAATGLAKDAVDRREVPLGFDPADHHTAYDELQDLVSSIEDLLDGLPANADGMRWRAVDGATVFEMSRHIRAPFDAFVARVDVGAGISMMADYLGGRRIVVPGGPDPARVRQAERNLYLPQPNYLAIWGGLPIDVCKIELVERGPDRHRLTWQTISSPNGSATYDDGSLTFDRVPDGVVATVRGRQRFALPPAWAGVNLDAWPEVRDPLLEEAYRRFFTTTFDNLEACYEGRDYRIGRPAPDPTEPLVTETIALLLGAAKDWLDEHGAGGLVGNSAQTVGVVDAQGFRHVSGRR